MADIELLPPPERVVVDTHIPTGVRIYAYDAATLSDYTRANVEHHTEKLREEIEALKQDLDQYRDAVLKEHEHAERLQDLCAAAYQLAGVHDAPVEWLDALSNAANGKPFSTDGLLPYKPEAVCDAEARAKKLEEALRAIRKHTGEHNTHGG